jgi:galactose mutarotase-like enzyme
MGIWAAKNAEFVCIEPWCGIADAVNTNQKLINKEGIIDLEAGGQFERSFSMEV